jgi:hypothetical protein
MERLPRYKSFFEKNERADKALSLKEKVEGYQKKLDYLKFRLSEVAAAAAPAAPVAAAPVEDQETEDDVINKGLSNLVVTIVKDYGLDSEALDKLIKMARSMNAAPEEAPAEEPAASEDELQLDLGDESEAPAEEEPAADDELNLDLGDEEEAPAEEPAAEEPAPEAPAEEPAAEPAGKKKSQPEIEKDLDLDDEATKPLDLADFSFKA